MIRGDVTTAIEDVEFLARSEHRVDTLAALAEQPRSRSTLRELTGASSSTVSRMLREFETRRWIVRTGHEYEATELGSFVASGMKDLLERLDTERKLRDVWERLPTAEEGFTLEMASSAVVTVSSADDPYAPVNRFESLLEGTSEFRFVGSDLALLEPCKDEFRRRILGGMRAEIIDPPSVARYVLSAYADHCAPALESGNLTIMLYDELPPYGLALFDRRVAISCYNPANGTVQAFVDTDSLETREWAESTYASFRREARPLTVEMAVG